MEQGAGCQADVVVFFHRGWRPRLRGVLPYNLAMPLSGAHLIDGRWQSSKPVFSAFDPATGVQLPVEFSQAGQTEVDAALAAAIGAFAADLEHGWQARLLESIAVNIEKLGPGLLDRAHSETALPMPRLTGERGRTINQLKQMAERVREGSWVEASIDTADPDRQPLPKPDVRRMRVPRGPVAVFGASNFPFAFGACGNDTAAALAAGCPVIVKGHPLHPGSSELFASAVLAALEETNLPRGLYSLLQGPSPEFSRQLVSHPDLCAVGFTGSRKAGRAVFDIAAQRTRPIPVFAEMGSLNPLVLLPRAIRDRGEQIAKDLAASILLGAGQFCTKPGLILTIGPEREFFAKLAGHLKNSAPLTMLSSRLRDGYEQVVRRWTGTSNVHTLLGGEPTGHANITPSLFQTTAANFAEQNALQEEAFGPAALAVDCRSDEIQRVLQTIGGGLTGSIHFSSGDDCKPILHALAKFVGRVVFNGYPTGVEVCHSMMHGGPYPATTDGSWTSVGTSSISRFVNLRAYQNTPDDLLPQELQKSNPLGILRTVNGRLTKDPA